MGEVPDEHRMELLQNRTESQDVAMPSNAIDQGHELAVLFGELVVDLLER